MSLSRDEFEKATQDWLDGRLRDEDFDRIQLSMRGSAEFRRHFIRMTNLDSGLRDCVGSIGAEDGGGDFAVPFTPAPTPAAGSPRGRAVSWYAIAATAGLLLAVVWILRSGPAGGGDPVQPESRALGVAVVTAESGATWGKTEGPAIRAGISLPPGLVRLEKGLAQIEFFGGASVSLAGPAEIELIGPDEAVLHRGRLRADVPPAARGFEIRTADVRLEDLGTSFGLSAEPGTGGELVVFDGEVRAIEADGASSLLNGGEALRLEAGRTRPQDFVEVDRFPDISEVFAGSGDRDELRHAAWKEASLRLREDPRLVAYYDFENLTPVSRRLRNRARHGGGSELDGGIVGARVAEGRWENKTALDFRLEGDRVRFRIPGEFDSLTLVAWVRIDALDRGLNSLFLTDFYDEREIHWQISRRGALHFACSPEGAVDLERHNRRFYSEPFWNPGKSGRWFHLATTVAGVPAAGAPAAGVPVGDEGRGAEGRRQVTHYVNGEAVGFSGGANREKPIPRMRIGEADLGNWSKPIWPDAAIRTLNGRIDEFAIFSDALSPGEIRDLYEIGKP